MKILYSYRPYICTPCVSVQSNSSPGKNFRLDTSRNLGWKVDNPGLKRGSRHSAPVTFNLNNHPHLLALPCLTFSFYILYLSSPCKSLRASSIAILCNFIQMAPSSILSSLDFFFINFNVSPHPFVPFLYQFTLLIRLVLVSNYNKYIIYLYFFPSPSYSLDSSSDVALLSSSASSSASCLLFFFILPSNTLP